MKNTILFFALATFCVFGAEYLKNGDFESGSPAPWNIYTKEHNATLSILTDTAPEGGRGVLGIHIPQGNRKIAVRQNFKLAKGTYTFSCYVDTTRLTLPQGYVMLYIAGTIDNKWHNFGGVNIGGTKPKVGWTKSPWTKLEKEFTVPENGVATSVWIECVNTVGTVMVDNVSIRDDKPEPKPLPAPQPVSAQKKLAVTLTPSGKNALFTASETPEIKFTMTDVPKDTTLDVAFMTVDYFGRKVKAWKDSLQLKAGEDFSKTLSFPELKRSGFYCTTATWKTQGSVNGNQTGTAQASFVIVGPKPSPTDPLFGISVFAPEDAERYSLMGVGTKGVYFIWRNLDDGNGNLQLDDIRKSVKALRAAGIRLIGHLSTVDSTGRAPLRFFKKKIVPKQDPIEDLDAYFKAKEEFVKTIVSEFKDDIHEWAASGEINLIAFQADYARQRYIDDVKLLSRAIREADPTATFVALGCSGADGRANPRYPFLRGLLPAIVDDIDGFGIDQYTAGQTYGKGYVNKTPKRGRFAR